MTSNQEVGPDPMQASRQDCSRLYFKEATGVRSFEFRNPATVVQWRRILLEESR